VVFQLSNTESRYHIYNAEMVNMFNYFLERHDIKKEHLFDQLPKKEIFLEHFKSCYRNEVVRNIFSEFRRRPCLGTNHCAKAPFVAECLNAVHEWEHFPLMKKAGLSVTVLRASTFSHQDYCKYD
jgi:hypothetical protein